MSSMNLNYLEKILKSLANKRRLEILKYLIKEKEATVSDIAKEIKLSLRSTSKHLAVLKAANVVEREQRNVEAWYKIHTSQPPILNLILGRI